VGIMYRGRAEVLEQLLHGEDGNVCNAQWRKIGPIKTTIALHRRLLETPDFVNATFDIHYVERFLKKDAS